jgi:phage shock protein E
MRIFQMVMIFGFFMLAMACNAPSQTEKVDYKTAFLVDVRTPEEFAEGSAAGAVNIPLQEIGQRLEEFKGKNQIVVFCRSGNRSSQAKSILEQNGFKNIINGGTWEQVRDSQNNQTK